MSKKPAKKMMKAPVRKFPTAKFAAAAKFTTRPRKVKKFGFTPVAASAPTILSSSHLLPLPILLSASPYLVRSSLLCVWASRKNAPISGSAHRTTPRMQAANRPIWHITFFWRGAIPLDAHSPGDLQSLAIEERSLFMFRDSNRRQFLLQSVTGFSAAWISAQWPALVAAAEHGRREAQLAARQRLEFFSPAEAVEIDAISSRVIPTDETPGAHEAGVVYFIDRALTTFAADSQAIFRDGLPELQARVTEIFPQLAKFSAGTPEQQDQVLHSF